MTPTLPAARRDLAGRALLVVLAVGAVAIVAAWTGLTAWAAAVSGHGGLDAPWIALGGAVCVACGLVFRSDVLALPVGCGAVAVAAARTPDVARGALLEGPVGFAWAVAFCVAVALVFAASVRRDRVARPRTRPIPAEAAPAPAAMHAWRGVAGVALLVVPVAVVVAQRGLGHAQPGVAGVVFAVLLLVFTGLIGFYSTVATPALNARWDAIRLQRETDGSGRTRALLRLAAAAAVCAAALALLL